MGQFVTANFLSFAYYWNKAVGCAYLTSGSHTYSRFATMLMAKSRWILATLKSCSHLICFRKSASDILDECGLSYLWCELGDANLDYITVYPHPYQGYRFTEFDEANCNHQYNNYSLLTTDFIFEEFSSVTFSMSMSFMWFGFKTLYSLFEKWTWQWLSLYILD